MADDDALARVADELYGLAPDEFTAARNARAKQLKPDDRALAAKIGELRKPSAVAWVVNQLVRHRADELDDLLALGDELRAAQADLDAASLTQLARERRKLVGAMARQAGALADELGHPARGSTLDEVAETLQAALTDAAAAAAVRSGRLVRGLEAVGTEVDLDGAVAGGPVGRASGSAAGSGSRRRRSGTDADADAGAEGSEADDAASGRGASARGGRGGPVAVPDAPEEDARFAARRKAERERAERQAAEAEERAEAAEQAEAEASERLDEARELADRASAARDDLEHRVRELEAELAEAERALAEAQRAVRPLEREHDRAARSADEARAAADELRAELD
ncbi:hypothetical protein GE115_15285 [Agromyces sp. CFH 90414]|uniref:Uncharacterized protein n=1 Tax=Agromyces agglutinans TaxID=2662258 RepID=A0A6I2FBM8_9MICO|nr:hypothetical protein [Agromyces agglutinans]MRG61217.1 hypothetical protein [Agromyces agglutinans]